MPTLTFACAFPDRELSRLSSLPSLDQAELIFPSCIFFTFFFKQRMTAITVNIIRLIIWLHVYLLSISPETPLG